MNHIEKCLLIVGIAFASINVSCCEKSDDDFSVPTTRPTTIPASSHSDDFQSLFTTTVFTSELITDAGSLSSDVASFRQILQDENARQLFLYLADYATPAGQLYGMCGLYLVDQSEFKRRQRNFESRTDSITTFFGCTVNEHRKVGEVFREYIKDGNFPRSFQTINTP